MSDLIKVKSIKGFRGNDGLYVKRNMEISVTETHAKDLEANGLIVRCGAEPVEKARKNAPPHDNKKALDPKNKAR